MALISALPLDLERQLKGSCRIGGAVGNSSRDASTSLDVEGQFGSPIPLLPDGVVHGQVWPPLMNHGFGSTPEYYILKLKQKTLVSSSINPSNFLSHLKAIFPKALVKISASCSVVGPYFDLTLLEAIFSLMKWCFTSMCFVHT